MAGKTKIFVYGLASIVGGIASVSAYYRFKNKSAFPALLLGWNFPLVSSEPLARNTKLLKFQLPPNAKTPGITPGSAVFTKMYHPITGKKFSEQYTTIYCPEDPTKLVLAVKNVNEEGESGALNMIRPGFQVKFWGPKPGECGNPDKINSVNFVAGGSGVTPFYSLAKYLLLNKPSSKINLILANKTEDDIMFKKELNQMQAQNPDRFSLTYVLDQGTEDAHTRIGHITPELLKEKIWKDTPVYLCGPPGMVHSLNNRKHSILKEISGKKVTVFD